MKITNVHFVSGVSAFYFDDQAAIKSGAVQDGFSYLGAHRTNGFSQIRQKGECLSILLELENGQIAQGDCVAVQYSGAAGRDPVFLSKEFIPLLKSALSAQILNRDARDFLANAKFADQAEIAGQRMHTALRYGLSLAFLDAAAKAQNKLMAEIVADAYQLEPSPQPLKFFGQSGDDRYMAVDKMIMKSVPCLPHGLINNLQDKVGRNGGKLLEYMSWISARITKLRTDPGYRPVIHIDVYGTLGQLFDLDAEKIADYLGQLSKRAAPFDLYIEGPIDAGSKRAQIDGLHRLSAALRKAGHPVKIVADEWCNDFADIKDFTDAKCCDMIQIKTPDLGSIHNTIEAVLYCKENGIETYQGGSCNETDITARGCVHTAMATQPDRVLVKPGMGFDEGYTIVHNEMQRIITLLNARKSVFNDAIREAV